MIFIDRLDCVCSYVILNHHKPDHDYVKYNLIHFLSWESITAIVSIQMWLNCEILNVGPWFQVVSVECKVVNHERWARMCRPSFFRQAGDVHGYGNSSEETTGREQWPSNSDWQHRPLAVPLLPARWLSRTERGATFLWFVHRKYFVVDFFILCCVLFLCINLPYFFRLWVSIFTSPTFSSIFFFFHQPWLL